MTSAKLERIRIYDNSMRVRSCKNDHLFYPERIKELHTWDNVCYRWRHDPNADNPDMQMVMVVHGVPHVIDAWPCLSSVLGWLLSCGHWVSVTNHEGSVLIKPEGQDRRPAKAYTTILKNVTGIKVRALFT